MKNGKRSGCRCAVLVMAVAGLVLIGGLSGCSTLDRAYRQAVTWTDAPVVRVVTNEVVVSRSVVGRMGTNVVAELVTNFVPVFYTNLAQVPVTNLVARPEALATIEAAGGVVNTFAPGIGSVVALVVG